jgi:hypothetical protein
MVASDAATCALGLPPSSNMDLVDLHFSTRHLSMWLVLLTERVAVNRLRKRNRHRDPLDARASQPSGQRRELAAWARTVSSSCPVGNRPEKWSSARARCGDLVSVRLQISWRTSGVPRPCSRKKNLGIKSNNL